MVVERIPGEKVYIDWVGDQPEILFDKPPPPNRVAVLSLLTG